MKLNLIVCDAEEGGCWAEVPAIPGCAPQGETCEEPLASFCGAVEGCLSIDLEDIAVEENDRILEVAV